jgi:carbon-monoxide dehydrogenase medium subunit
MFRFNFYEPESLADVVSRLQEYGDDAALLAGGTALLVDMRHGELSPEHIISLWGAPELAGIKSNGGYRIGTLTSVTDLANTMTQPPYESLSEAARLLGSRQIQNMATVGGNICKASPGADLVPPLMCLDAELRLVGPEGERIMPLDGFLTGPDETAIRPAEVLVEIVVPTPSSHSGTSFQKVMRRHAIDCSIVAVAARVTLDVDGETCKDVRIGLSAVAPNPFRAKEAEKMLKGQKVNPDTVSKVAAQARDEASPITDVRASADYRRMLVETLVERSILKAAERASDGGRH